MIGPRPPDIHDLRAALAKETEYLGALLRCADEFMALDTRPIRVCGDIVAERIGPDPVPPTLRGMIADTRNRCAMLQQDIHRRAGR